MISTRKHLDYASGYLALNLFAEARAELAQIPEAEQDTSEVLAVRLELAMARSTWKQVVKLASKLSRQTPADERPWIAWAYALRELQLIGDAFDVLIMGESVIDDPSPLVDYNLACYHCLLGDLPEALRRLKRACAREPSWKLEAATDPDLSALQPDHNG